MLVQRILKFIQTLKQLLNIPSFDQKLLRDLDIYFANKLTDSELIQQDFEFIHDCYSKRWSLIFDSEIDYTLDPIGINEIWIELGREMDGLAGKNFQQVLIPSHTNLIDFNNQQFLTLTERLENLYLGSDGETLYRKRGLCDHLINTHFELSTFRDKNQTKLSAMTVVELARLKRCKQPHGEFKINEEEFSSFWDFLNRKVFTTLQNKGSMPRHLLPQLLELINNYYTSKINLLDFAVFKQDINTFFEFLYKHDLHTINYFYGIKISYKGEPHYLLELLIQLHMAQSYNLLEETMLTLSQYLYEFDPVLKVKYQKLNDLYLQLPSAKVEKREAHLNSLKTLRLVVFLLTTHFDNFRRYPISVLDKANNVSSDGADIYKYLLPYIENNQKDKLINIYPDVIHNYISPNLNNPGLFKILTQSQSTTDWFNVVYNANFAKIGVYWFAPEVLIWGLMDLSLLEPKLGTKINHFLDDLIHSYALNENILKTEIRVNIEFVAFMRQLTESQKSNLILALNLYDVQIAKENFMMLCKHYLSCRMVEIFVNKEYVTYFNALENQGNVSDLIVAFRQLISSPKLQLIDTEQPLHYLHEVSKPILTVEEKDFAARSSHQADYCASFT